MDKSRSYSKNETEDTVKTQNKTISISSASLDDKDTKEQQPKEIKFRNETLRSEKTNCFKYVCTWIKYNNCIDIKI